MTETIPLLEKFLSMGTEIQRGCHCIVLCDEEKLESTYVSSVVGCIDQFMMWVELCPPKRYVQVLTSICEYDLTWKYSLCRCS